MVSNFNLGKNSRNNKSISEKGSKVLVEGRLNPDPDTGGPRLWERQDGTSAASYEVTANVVRFLSSRAEDEAAYTVSEGEGAANDEDIPF